MAPFHFISYVCRCSLTYFLSSSIFFQSVVSSSCNAMALVSLDVRDFGAKCDGINDDTAAIQTAAKALPVSGGDLVFPNGVCLVSNTTFLKSNTHVVGRGATLSNMPAPAWLHGIGGAFSLNNIENIVIEGMNFKWQKGFYHGGVAHIIESINSRNIIVRSNVSVGGGDFLASIGGDGILVEDNNVTEVDNACYDFWGGVRNVNVIRNVCATTARKHAGVGGIQFTAINTDGSPAKNSHFFASENIVTINTRSGQAFEINGSPLGGANEDIAITNNRISIASNAWGILITYSSNGTITKNVIKATNPSILGALYVAETSSNWIVDGNKAQNIPNGPNAIFTNKGSGGSLSNNLAVGITSPRLFDKPGPGVITYNNSFAP